MVLTDNRNVITMNKNWNNIDEGEGLCYYPLD